MSALGPKRAEAGRKPGQGYGHRDSPFFHVGRQVPLQSTLLIISMRPVLHRSESSDLLGTTIRFQTTQLSNVQRQFKKIRAMFLPFDSAPKPANPTKADAPFRRS